MTQKTLHHKGLLTRSAAVADSSNPTRPFPSSCLRREQGALAIFQIMWSPNIVAILLLVLVVTTATRAASEAQDTRDNHVMPGSLSGRENRQLQLQPGDDADGLVMKSRCSYQDSFTDPRLVCELETSLMSSSSSVTVDVALNCSSTSSTIPFRDIADACQCTAIVTANGESKGCPCAACPAGFGDNPVFVDCGTDNTLIDTCSSIDCQYKCNGPNKTAILTLAPTASPTVDPVGSLGEGHGNATVGPTPVGGGEPSGARLGYCVSMVLAPIVSILLQLSL